jgi:hypothetical protein
MSAHAVYAPLRALVSFGSGALFGVGLALSHMTDPLRVLGFLDVAGDWDARLIAVLAGAVLVSALLFALARRRGKPQWSARFHLPDSDVIDHRLLLGAIIFGAGWGLAGYCPGPAIASLAYFNNEALWLVPAMLAGSALRQWQLRGR